MKYNVTTNRPTPKIRMVRTLKVGEFGLTTGGHVWHRLNTGWLFMQPDPQGETMTYLSNSQMSKEALNEYVELLGLPFTLTFEKDTNPPPF